MPAAMQTVSGAKTCEHVEAGCIDYAIHRDDQAQECRDSQQHREDNDAKTKARADNSNVTHAREAQSSSLDIGEDVRELRTCGKREGEGGNVRMRQGGESIVESQWSLEA